MCLSYDQLYQQTKPHTLFVFGSLRPGWDIQHENVLLHGKKIKVTCFVEARPAVFMTTCISRKSMFLSLSFLRHDHHHTLFSQPYSDPHGGKTCITRVPRVIAITIKMTVPVATIFVHNSNSSADHGIHDLPRADHCRTTTTKKTTQ